MNTPDSFQNAYLWMQQITPPEEQEARLQRELDAALLENHRLRTADERAKYWEGRFAVIKHENNKLRAANEKLTSRVAVLRYVEACWDQVSTKARNKAVKKAQDALMESLSTKTTKTSPCNLLA